MANHLTTTTDDDRRGVALRTTRGLLALLALPGVGPTKALRAAVFTTNYDELLEQHYDAWDAAIEASDRELEVCSRRGVHVLSIFDDPYPQRLRALHDPPPLLFVEGSVEVLNQPRAVAVVGTREPTRFGCSATEAVTAALAGAGWSVVSGLAKGIDTLAHGAALKHGTPTVAVMAGGLDSIYPAENRELAAAVIDQGGALVSEVRLGVRPQKSAFVRRNRIQSALSAAVVVGQTGLIGGTMHTVRHAAMQRRAVFCPVPHSAHEKNAGLRVLLETPARELCGVIPAWREARSVCQRLGSEPLARAIAREHIDDFLEALELALDDPQTQPEPRWWAAPERAERASGDRVVADDDALFSFAD